MITQTCLKINHRTFSIRDVSPSMTLLEYLRYKGLVGTKEGCGDGDCGACTVAIIGEDINGQAEYKAVNSCLIPIGSLVGREIFTVEGIAQNKLHPVQEAMVKTGGSQCGYCTPGFIMSMFAAYYSGKVDDVSIEGNLCRCTGYLPIRRAASIVTNAKPEDDFSEKLAETSPILTEWNYQNQTEQFYRPLELSKVLEILKENPEAVLIAGGTDLGLELSHHTREYPILISLEAVKELHGIRETETTVEIGAAVPLTHIETQLKGMFPSVDTMIHWFAASQVRNRATLGGNLGTASPIGDMLPVLLSLDAKLQIASAEGLRVVEIANFFKGYRQTDLKPQEVIVSVQIPRTLPQGALRRLSQSYKIGKRGTDDISIVAAAYTIDLDESDRIVQARLAYGGVAATPIRATDVEAILIGKPWQTNTVQKVKQVLRETFNPLSDLRASAEYRRMLVANLFEKFFEETGGSQVYAIH